MPSEYQSNDQLKEYYRNWISVYKEGAIRDVTLRKYQMSLAWIEKLAPDLRLCELTRVAYQQIINEYAKDHERQTTMDFHHQLKGAVLDAVDEGLIPRDPTRKVIIKGRTPTSKTIKYLNQFELHTLLKSHRLGESVSFCLWRRRACVFRKHWRSHQMILTSHTRRFPSTRRGTIRMAVDLHRRRINLRSERFRLTGRSSCSLHRSSRISRRVSRSSS